MALKPYPMLTLPNDLIEKCQEFAVRLVAGYSAGRNPQSRAVASHGAEANVALQAQAKMAECAFCRAIGYDEVWAVHWGGAIDCGYDVFWPPHRVDIKHTAAGNQFLIWPIKKNGFFNAKPFDVLVLVTSAIPVFMIAGWTSKARFAKNHQVAGVGHPLTAGTRYMHKDELWPMSTL